MKEKKIYFDDVHESIPGGDILLSRPVSVLGRAIARVRGSRYSHVALTAWKLPSARLFHHEPAHGRVLYLIDTLQWYGGEAIPLKDSVTQYPGVWDWYHVEDEWRVSPHEISVYDRLASVRKAAEVIGKRYGWLNLGYSAMREAAIVRWFIPPDYDDMANGKHLPHCADNAARALCAGGRDPTPNLANRAMLPVDFERSAVLRYQGTLYWEDFK